MVSSFLECIVDEDSREVDSGGEYYDEGIGENKAEIAHDLADSLTAGTPHRTTILIHHTNTAAHAWNPVTTATTSLGSAVVAELICAENACHMVTPGVSLDLRAAYWAKDNSLCTSAPAFELHLHRILAARAVAVPVLTAAEANCMRALRAVHLFRIDVASLHMPITVRLGAESNEWVTFEEAAIAEVVQLIKQLLRFACEDLFQLLYAYLLTALVLKAGDLG